MAGCETSGRDPRDPIDDREEAISEAHRRYEVARSQGVDFREAPCIYDAGSESEWVIVVDMSVRGRFDEVARECPSFGSGTATHAVVLAPDGEVIAAR